MAESRTNGGGSRNGAHSVNTGVAPSAESTHESEPGDGARPDASAADVLKKGDTLGRYLVIEQIGAGAMGVVYAAYDPELDRKIAIKILRPHEGKGDKTRRQERLVREAKAMAKLSHPNVGAIYDVGVHGDQVFLAMEFLSGGTLRDWVTAKKRPWREIVKMFIEVGKGLAGAHAEGLIHRDFKPDNVLIDKNGAPKVVDFGLVRLTSAALDRSTTGSIDIAATEEDETASLPLAQTALAASDPDGRDRRHARVHGARAVPRQGDRRAHGPVRVLHRALRGAVRRAAVRGRHASSRSRTRSPRDACVHCPRTPRSRPGYVESSSPGFTRSLRIAIQVSKPSSRRSWTILRSGSGSGCVPRAWSWRSSQRWVEGATGTAESSARSIGRSRKRFALRNRRSPNCHP